jgi:hypothetical protein
MADEPRFSPDQRAWERSHSWWIELHRYRPALSTPVEPLGGTGHLDHAASARRNEGWRSGSYPDVRAHPPRQAVGVPHHLVHHHRHSAVECEVVFASPLRYGTALASCRTGGHEIWWSVTAESEAAAFYLLPTFVSGTSTATSFDEVRVP